MDKPSNSVNTAEMLNTLSLEEKAGLLTGYGPMGTMPVERFGIPAKIMSDGPHGVRFDHPAGENSTHFPNLCALSSSWDKTAAYRMGEALGKECRHHKKDMLLGPGVNIKRHILCGRNFEYLSEDPVLAGELAAAYIRGLQGEGVSACLKHLAVNNQEKNRDRINVEVDERTLREIYLKPFQIAVQKGKPDAVMCAYNKLEAIWCSENPFLLTQVLRKEWGFEGLVVSDWGAVHHSVRAIKAGMDLIMPRRGTLYEEIRRGIADKTLSEEALDRAAGRVLEWAGRQKAAQQPSDYDRARQHEAAVRIARESMVLLKNERQALPLAASKDQKIAVIGEYALHPLTGGQGSAEVYPDQEYIDSPLEELKAALPDTEIRYLELYRKAAMPERMLWPKLGDFKKFVEDCSAVVFFAGEMESESTENFDRRSAQINPNIDFFIDAACDLNKKVIVVLQSGGALILGDWRERVDAVVQMWLAGEGAGRAVSDILTGRVNPCGKLAETFPKKQRSDVDFGDEMRVKYREGLEVGYRYYDRHPEEIAFPFGHGLSYTDFGYADGAVWVEGETLKIRLKVTNLGSRAGAEVVQVYAGQCAPVASRPVKELKAFEKVFLEAGGSRELAMEIPVKELGYYNTMLHDWVAESDTYRISVGASSRDIRLEQKIRIENEMPYSLQRTGEVMVG